MPKKHYSRRERFYSSLITLFSICAVVLIALLFLQSYFDIGQDTPAQTASQSSGATAEPMTLRVTLPPDATAVPVAATPSPTPAVEDAEYDFLPVYSRVDTQEKMIAITVEDCSHQGNIRELATYTAQLGGKLTLFPFGQSVMQEGMDYILRVCVFQLGFQVENRTWSDGALYRISDAELATEIWSADVAVDFALGKDYAMHLFRMRSGSGTRDVRTHEYLKQLGYDGIVTWTVSGSDVDIEKLRSSLGPGKIYRFTSSGADCEKMTSFMRYAVDQGYRLVTVNELLGLPANACTEAEDTDILTRTLPALEGYTPVYVEHSIGDRAWQVYLIQTRLAELGWLAPGSADGVYGDGTSAAISAFQARCGLLGTGVASTQTQVRLFAADAPTSPVPVTAAPES